MSRRLFGRRLMAMSVAALSCGIAAPALARPLEIADLWRLEAVSRAYTAPDGRRLLLETLAPYASAGLFDDDAFVLTERARLSLIDTRAARPRLRPVGPDRGVIALGFSPSGRRLAVGRVEGRRLRLGILALASERVAWTSLVVLPPRNGPSVRWLGEQRLVAFSPLGDAVSFPMGAPGQEALQARRRRQMTGGLSGPRVSGAGRFSLPAPPDARLIALDLRSGARTTLAVGAFDDLAPSPSGRYIALTAPAEAPAFGGRAPVTIFDGFRRRRLTILDLSTRRISQPCPDCDLAPGLLEWAPDAERLLVFARTGLDRSWSDGRYVETSSHGVAVPIVTPGYQPDVPLTPGVFLPAVQGGWADGEPVVRLRRTDGAPAAGLFRVSAGSVASQSPSFMPVWRGVGGGIREQLTAGRAGFGAPAATPPEGVVLAEAGPAALIEHRSALGVVRIELRRGTKLQPVAELNVRLGEVEPAELIPLKRTASTGRAVVDWLYLPRGRSSGRRRPPLVVVPYPGSSPDHEPGLQVLGSSPHLIYAQVLVAHGYAVLAPGLPRKPDDEPGDRIADDVLAAVDGAVATGRIDPDQAAVWGHSFGGYASLVLATRTHRFRAFIASAAPSDLASLYGTFSGDARARPSHVEVRDFDIGWSEAGQGALLGPPWRDPDRYRRNSPLFSADKVSAPLLLICGDQDFFDMTQEEEMFTALRRQDKDVRLLVFPGEGHVLASPTNQAAFYRAAFAFLDEAFGPPARQSP